MQWKIYTQAQAYTPYQGAPNLISFWCRLILSLENQIKTAAAAAAASVAVAGVGSNTKAFDMDNC